MDLAMSNDLPQEDSFLPPRKQTVLVENRYDRGGPGRPPSFPLEPKDEMVGEIMKRRERTIKKGSLRRTINQNPDSPDVLDTLMEEMAREVHGLEFDRKEEIRKEGEADPTYSSKRVTALKSIGNLFFKKRDMILDEMFDLESEKFQKLFKFWLHKIRDAALKVLTEEQVQLLFDKIEEEFEDWEDEAKSYIKTDF
jgi:hypothetical protein